MSERLQKRADDFAESRTGKETHNGHGQVLSSWVKREVFRDFCLESLLIKQESFEILEALSEQIPQPDARLYVHINRLKARLGIEG